MLSIDPRASTPINDQIKAGLRGLVARGVLKPGDAAPSIRSLAVDLKVNPNTVARAFRELALEGFFDSRRGEGNTISPEATRRAKDGLDQTRARLDESLRLARRGGLDWAEIESRLKKVRSEEK